MIVKYGAGSAPKGMLPVYSVDTEDEARRLLKLTCPTNAKGDYLARELIEEQTLENLYAFGDRLHAVYTEHEHYIKTGRPRRAAR